MYVTRVLKTISDSNGYIYFLITKASPNIETSIICYPGYKDLYLRGYFTAFTEVGLLVIHFGNSSKLPYLVGNQIFI